MQILCGLVGEVDALSHFFGWEIHTLGLAETCKNQEPSDKDANSD